MRLILSFSGGQWLRGLLAWLAFAAFVATLGDWKSPDAAVAGTPALTALAVASPSAARPAPGGVLVRHDVNILDLQALEAPAFGDYDAAD